MSSDKQTGTPEFRVIDAFDAPHFGQILKLRLVSGRTPSLSEIKGSRFKAMSPDGQEATVRVVAFSMIGGKTSQARFARTGRVDVVAMGENGGPSVSLRWILTGPA